MNRYPSLTRPSLRPHANDTTIIYKSELSLTALRSLAYSTLQTDTKNILPYLVVRPLLKFIMSYRQPLTLLAVATAVLAKPSPLIASRQDNTTHNGIQWGECDFNASVPIECGRLGVPLDYTDPGAGTLDLSLSKVAAVNEPFKGSILFNFGGPGFEAIKTLGSLAPQLLKYVRRYPLQFLEPFAECSMNIEETTTNVFV